MPDGNQLADVFTKLWPEYADVVGSSLLSRVADDVANDRHTDLDLHRDSGTPFVLKDALTIVGHALTFIKLVFDAYKFLKERKGDAPAATEIEVAVIRKAAPAVKQIATSPTGRAVISSLVE